MSLDHPLIPVPKNESVFSNVCHWLHHEYIWALLVNDFCQELCFRLAENIWDCVYLQRIHQDLHKWIQRVVVCMVNMCMRGSGEAPQDARGKCVKASSVQQRSYSFLVGACIMSTHMEGDVSSISVQLGYVQKDGDATGEGLRVYNDTLKLCSNNGQEHAWPMHI
jgi:hypothetical protein